MKQKKKIHKLVKCSNCRIKFEKKISEIEPMQKRFFCCIQCNIPRKDHPFRKAKKFVGGYTESQDIKYETGTNCFISGKIYTKLGEL